MTFHEKVAEVLELSPERLEIPLQNIERWLAKKEEPPDRFIEWKSLILKAQSSPQEFKRLLAILRSNTESDLHLKSFTPFHGILTREERRPTILECAFRHSNT